ncbi:MAG: phosphoglycerate kinase [Deltaproteobacteria bacterium]|jgi:phosphoglycerate kinase|nr:phosphoglycerate kinase [Deltaproteobacteria bacterium]
MRFGIKTIDELKVAGRTILLRVDINLPIDHQSGALKDITRIRAILPTIRELSTGNAKTVILAHQGGDLDYDNLSSLKPHSQVLNEYLNGAAQFVEDICGPTALEAIKRLKPGGILLLENLRYLAEEQTGFERTLRLTPLEQAHTLLVRKLTPLADYFINDAFGTCHRDQPSLCGFPELLPTAMGRLFEKEFCVLSQLTQSPDRPCLFILGGVKVGDSLAVIERLLENNIADRILTGGQLAKFLARATGKKPDNDFPPKGSALRPLWERALDIFKRFGDKVVIPVDFAYVQGGQRVEAARGEIPPNVRTTDIGYQTVKQYSSLIDSAKTVVVNGIMGDFTEPYSMTGTRLVWESLCRTNAFTVLGGGQAISAATKFGQLECFSYISTGGLALILFLTGEELPVIRSLRRGSQLNSKKSPEPFSSQHRRDYVSENLYFLGSKPDKNKS